MNVIKRFNNDVKKLHVAQAAQQKDGAALKHAKTSLASDTHELKHDRDVFQSQTKTLKTDRAQLKGLQDKMDGFEAQATTLQQELAVDPQNISAQQALAAVQQKEADLQPQLDAAKTKVSTLATQHADRRTQIHTDLKSQKNDTHAVKRDTAITHRARSRTRGARRKALNDLTPAEYKMNLKQTNAARKSVGLGFVNHLIRPGQISSQGKAQMSRLEHIAQSYASGRRPQGWCLKKVEDYLQSTSYGKIGHGNIPRFEYAHQFADYLNAGHRYASMGLQKLHIDNPYKAPVGSIIVVRAGTPGTANPVAGDIVVKGPGDRFFNDGEMSYGGSGNFPKGNSYVLGIYAPK